MMLGVVNGIQITMETRKWRVARTHINTGMKDPSWEKTEA